MLESANQSTNATLSPDPSFLSRQPNTQTPSSSPTGFSASQSLSLSSADSIHLTPVLCDTLETKQLQSDQRVEIVKVLQCVSPGCRAEVACSKELLETL